MKKKSDLNFNNIKRGQWIRVRFDDVGLRDCIIHDFDEKKQNFYVIEPYGTTVNRVNKDQIVLLGPVIAVPVF